MNQTGNFKPFRLKMETEGLPDLAIRTFEYYYDQLSSGAEGVLTKKEISPVDDVPKLEEAGDVAAEGMAALDKTVMIKLNGGLGTSMGMTRAKSLLPVKGELTFLDIIVKHVLALRKKHSCRTALLLMNSFSTRDDTLAHLERYPELAVGDLPLDFMQHKVPKILRDSLAPAVWEKEPEKEWCPPGHGDIYTALVTSGMLERLLGTGMEYAFISNGDNLGAVLEPAILGYFVKNRIPFLSEVTGRTEADKKGGHIARLEDGRLVLRETAQCPEEERPEFEDVHTYKYFNCNNLWINLPALKERFESNGGILGLSMIRNVKTVDPRDPASPKVIQLETAMGTAISVFNEARALEVPRDRFVPVKKCSDLLGLWSDAFTLTDDFQMENNPLRNRGPVVVELDDRYYKFIDQLRERFPDGAPSLAGCGGLEIKGDVKFGRGVVVSGDVIVENGGAKQWVVPDGTVIDKDRRVF